MHKQEPSPTDLTDSQWSILKPFLPSLKRDRPPANYERREIVNVILYLPPKGCRWHLLPQDFLPYPPFLFDLWMAQGNLFMTGYKANCPAQWNTMPKIMLPFLAVIQKNPLPFLVKVRTREDIWLWKVTRGNRNALPAQIKAVLIEKIFVK